MESQKINFDLLHPLPLLIVISGPSGVGKDAVLRELKKRKLNLSFVVTTTSRPPRAEETEGVDYHFVTKQEFKEMVSKNEMLEHALVYQDYKGVQKRHVKEALDRGCDVVIRVDYQGALHYRQLCPDAVLIFILPTDENEWYLRLSSRKTETPESLKVRVSTVKNELDALDKFDYMVVNAENRLNDAVDRIEDIIRAEHHRVHPRRINL